MSSRRTIELPLNRVEGDLEVRVELAGGVATDAYASATMFRGFERILKGRGPLDGLVITPRVCGICSVSHLSAAARALDGLTGSSLPPGAVKLRNALVLLEHVQSDVRHAVHVFAADFADPAYRVLPRFVEAVRRYEPLRGTSAVETIRETKALLEAVSLLAGQWPHTSAMVPGGLAVAPGRSELRSARYLVDRFRDWYERRFLGCPVERWSAVRSGADLDAWLEESPSHRDGEVGLFLALARGARLDRTGRGTGRFLSFGALDRPGGGRRAVPAGFATSGELEPLDETLVTEDVSRSWYRDDGPPRHPAEGETHPYASGREGGRYTWAKAPRYDGQPAETGPLAERVVAGDPLFTDLLARGGPSTLVRQLARVTRPAATLPLLAEALASIDPDEPFYSPPGPVPDGSAAGLTEATRGALGHWVTVRDGLIERYQIITPTTWNASPRDAKGQRGPIEEALVGTEVQDPENPVELGHVVRSFDACLVCTVHALSSGRSAGRVRLLPSP